MVDLTSISFSPLKCDGLNQSDFLLNWMVLEIFRLPNRHFDDFLLVAIKLNLDPSSQQDPNGHVKDHLLVMLHLFSVLQPILMRNRPKYPLCSSWFVQLQMNQGKVCPMKTITPSELETGASSQWICSPKPTVCVLHSCHTY